jgi:hypothetical protein
LIFSGSEMAKLEETFGDLPLWLAAENGVYVRPPIRPELPQVRARSLYNIKICLRIMQIVMGIIATLVATHETIRQHPQGADCSCMGIFDISATGEGAPCATAQDGSAHPNECAATCCAAATLLHQHDVLHPRAVVCAVLVLLL